MLLPIDRLAVGAVVGLCAGSFLNVLIHRIPIGESPWRPRRSYCPHCGASIRALDNVPVLSWLMLRGRCRDCAAGIAVRYPAVEIATAAAFAWVLAHDGLSLEAAHGAVFAGFLLTLAVIDLRSYRLPDVLVLSGAVAAAAFGAVEALATGSGPAVRDMLVSGGVGVALLGTVRLIGSGLFRREAMGFGDIKLIGMIGLFLGDWRLVIVTVVLSAVLGSVLGGLWVLLRKGHSTVVPYGPFLACAAWVSRMFGAQMADAYWRLISS